MKSALVRPAYFDSEWLDFELLRAMGYSVYGAAAPGECYWAAGKIRERGQSLEAWHYGWLELGNRVEESAAALESAGDRTAASEAYFRAWNYLRSAEFYMMPQGSAEMRGVYFRGLKCFDKALTLSSFSAAAVDIPYDGTTLPGHFFRAPASRGERRPLIVFNGGGDGSGEELFFLCGGPQALDRGFHVLTFHGPGHRGALHRNAKLVFRYDWEHVLGPVLDWAGARDEVDPRRMAVYGVSLGGYFAPRAASFDERIKAVVANALLPDYHQHWIATVGDQLPELLRKWTEHRLTTMSSAGWDRLAALFSLKGGPFTFVVDLMRWTNGVRGMGELMEKIRDASVDPSRVRCPLLSVQGEGEGAAALQAVKRWFDRLEGAKKHILLPAGLGADAHCGMGNLRHVNALVMDWLARTLVA